MKKIKNLGNRLQTQKRKATKNKEIKGIMKKIKK